MTKQPYSGRHCFPRSAGEGTTKGIPKIIQPPYWGESNHVCLCNHYSVVDATKGIPKIIHPPYWGRSKGCTLLVQPLLRRRCYKRNTCRKRGIYRKLKRNLDKFHLKCLRNIMNIYSRIVLEIGTSVVVVGFERFNDIWGYVEPLMPGRSKVRYQTKRCPSWSGI